MTQSEAILAYLERQGRPRTFGEIFRAIGTHRENTRLALADMVNKQLISRHVSDGVSSYTIMAKKMETNTMTDKKIQPVQAFQANDGTLFSSEKEALAHNIGLEIIPTIRKHLDSKKMDKKAHGNQMAVILKWEVWKALN